MVKQYTEISLTYGVNVDGNGRRRKIVTGAQKVGCLLYTSDLDKNARELHNIVTCVAVDSVDEVIEQLDFTEINDVTHGLFKKALVKFGRYMTDVLQVHNQSRANIFNSSLQRIMQQFSSPDAFDNSNVRLFYGNGADVNVPVISFDNQLWFFKDAFVAL